MYDFVFYMVGIYIGIGLGSAVHAHVWGRGYCSPQDLRKFTLMTIIMWPWYWWD